MNNTITQSAPPPRWQKLIPGIGLALVLLAGATGAGAQPANDNFADAINLPGDTGSRTGDTTVDATFQSGEPICVYPEAINTVWFKWTCTTSGALTLTTLGSVNPGSTEWDAVLCVYTGSSLSTLFPLLQQDSGYEETATIMVSAGTTYYIQLAGDQGSPPQDATDLHLSWTYSVPIVVDISNDLGPLQDGGININTIVGAGNIGRLVGTVQTYWASQGFTGIGIQLNTNSLIVDSGGGNVPFRAYGPISGDGSISFYTANNPANPTPINVQGNNTYTGTTLVGSGLISLENPDGQTALAGDITVGGPHSWQAAFLVWTTAGNQIADAATVTVTNGSYLDLNGHGETFNTLTLSSGTQVKTGLGTGNNLNVTTLIMGGTTYTTGYFGAAEAPGYVTGSGYILVGGTPPPVVTTPPDAPATPSPTNTATGISPLSQTLSWADSLRATSYDLYFWLSTDTKPASPTAPGLTVAHYAAPSPLADYGPYKWQVVAKNTAGSTPGPEWTFTTTSRTNISNALGPIRDGGMDIDAVVGVGNGGRLMGTVETYWGSAGFTVPLDLNGNTLNLFFGGNQNKVCSGAISGNGSVNVRYTGPAPGTRITGSSGNTYTGTTTVSDYVQLEKTSGNALCGTVTLDSASSRLVWINSDQISDASDVSLTVSGASLNIGDSTDTIHSLTMAAGTSIHTGDSSTGALTVSSLTTGGVSQPPGTYTASSPETAGYILDYGSVIVAGAVTAPVLTITSITGPDLSGNFTITGTSDTSTTVVLLKSTNVAAPLSGWGTVGSPQTGTSFNFSVPQGADTHAFFMLKVQ